MIKFLNIHANLLKAPGLSWMEKMLLSLIGLYTRKGKKNTLASDKYIAEELGVSHIYVNRTLTKLREKGLIKISKDLGRRSIELESYGKNYIHMFNKKNDEEEDDKDES